MLLGYARGSVGDVTFSRTKGQQVARARNRSPKVTNTTKTVINKSQLKTCIKFAKLMQNVGIPFHYNGKKTILSDYNEFVKKNKRRGYYMTAEMFTDPLISPLGNWIITDGKLSKFNVKYIANYSGNKGAFMASKNVKNLSPLIDPSKGTYSELSKALVRYFKCQQGDLITACIWDSDDKPGTATNPVIKGTDGDIFSMYQFKVDIYRDDEDKDLYEDEWLFKYADGVLRFGPNFLSEGADEVAIIHSRRGADGVEVSKTVFAMSPDATEITRLCKTKEWQAIVTASAKAADPSILEGAYTNQS